jgi:DNA (cytosine-5)-methyltransferase 1
MENVEGIVSINKGRTFNEILDTFREIGYHVTGRKLIATQFGIPQRRKRVIFIGSKLGDSSMLFPEPFLDEQHFITVKDAIGDIKTEPTRDIDDEIKTSVPQTPYQEFMQGIISPKQFIQKIQK